jgi:RNA polymerase-binding transcription factor DksA
MRLVLFVQSGGVESLANRCRRDTATALDCLTGIIVVRRNCSFHLLAKADLILSPKHSAFLLLPSRWTSGEAQPKPGIGQGLESKARLFVLACAQKWGKEAIMKLSRQTTIEQRSAGPKRKTRIKGEPKKSMCQHLMKQRAWLLRLREDLSKGIQQLAAEACEENPHYSMHMADAATDSFDRDLVLGLLSFEQEGLYEIDAALKRIEDGTYGICELTGKPIPWERLAAIPWTRFSIEAENQLEENIHPHIGRLGRVRMDGQELFAATPDRFTDEEIDLPEDPDLLPIRTEISVMAGRDDDRETGD